MGGFDVEARCCTSVGVGTSSGLTTRLMLLTSLSARAVARSVTTQVPGAAAVQVVEADACALNVPHPTGAALQEKVRGSPSASSAVPVSRTGSPIRTAVADAASEVITGEWSGRGAGPVGASATTGSGVVPPWDTTADPLPLPTTAGPANAVAVTVWVPAGTGNVPENVPPAPGVRVRENPAGSMVTETPVICALAVCAATVTWRNASSARGALLQAQNTRSARPARRTVQGTGRTTTNKLSVSASRFTVAVTLQVTSLLAPGVQVAVAEVAFGANDGCTIVPPQESERLTVPIGQASNEKVTVYGFPLWKRARMVASGPVRATVATRVEPSRKEMEEISGWGTYCTVMSMPPSAGPIWNCALRLADFAFAVAVNVTAQAPAVFAVRI